jgi:hypothetical protein
VGFCPGKINPCHAGGGFAVAGMAGGGMWGGEPPHTPPVAYSATAMKNCNIHLTFECLYATIAPSKALFGMYVG